MYRNIYKPVVHYIQSTQHIQNKHQYTTFHSASMESVEVLNVRLSRAMVAWLDSLVENGRYKSRAEAIRDFVREHLGREGA